MINAEPDLGKVPDELRSLVRRCLEKDIARSAEILAEVSTLRTEKNWLHALQRTFARDVPADSESSTGDITEGSYIPKSTAAPPIDAANRDDQWEPTDQEITDFLTEATLRQSQPRRS